MTGQAGEPVTPAELHVLAAIAIIALRKGVDGVTVKEIAEFTGKSESWVRTVLSRLKRKGYVVEYEEWRQPPPSTGTVLGDQLRMIIASVSQSGGTPKLWTIKDVNIHDTRSLREFFNSLRNRLIVRKTVDRETVNKLFDLILEAIERASSSRGG